MLILYRHDEEAGTKKGQRGKENHTRDKKRS